jgi:hypothetical protein
MKRGTGKSSATMVSWLSAEYDSRPERLRSTAPMISEMRRPLEARMSSSALEDVGDRRGSDGMLRMGSSSDDGEVGEWKVALLFKEGVDGGSVEASWKVVWSGGVRGGWFKYRRRGCECGEAISYRSDGCSRDSEGLRVDEVSRVGKGRAMKGRVMGMG